MFQSLLSITESFHKALQETLYLAEALIWKDALCDTLKDRRTDAFAIEVYERTKALCPTHSVTATLSWAAHRPSKQGCFSLVWTGWLVSLH